MKLPHESFSLLARSVVALERRSERGNAVPFKPGALQRRSGLKTREAGGKARLVTRNGGLRELETSLASRKLVRPAHFVIVGKN